MIPDLFEQLAQSDVPPPPPQFDRQLHERVNRSLVISQLLDLGLGALPWTIGHMLQALGGFLRFTVTGKFNSDKKRKQRPDGDLRL